MSARRAGRRSDGAEPGAAGVPGVTPVEAAVDLAPDPASVRVARTFVRDTVGSGVADDVRADLALAVSELVTNAIEHGRPAPVRVTVRVADPEVSVSVRNSGAHDGVAEVAAWAASGPDRHTGRGLAIVRTVVDRVDVARRGDEVEITVYRALR